jgi:hypothetical protein
MLLVCLLTIAVVYVHDTITTSRVAAGPTASQHGQTVNRNGALSEWGRVKENLRFTWNKLTGSMG